MKHANPFRILTHNERWAPSQDQIDAFQNAYEKLLPPLVYKIRLAVTKWREDEYHGASETSKSLLNFWFNEEHLIGQTKFSFFFSQREAIESIIYLYEIAKAKDKYELIRFDSSERVSAGMFDENWTRYVVKMATGSGKTKVMGLTLVWSYFHNYISLKLTKPKIAENQSFLIPKKSVFNKIIGDNDFELEFASYLENKFNDVISYAKNTMGDGGVNFRIEYQAEDGNIREYYPDFFVKTDENTFFIVETKGREDLDDIRKIKRLVIWCNDINSTQNDYTYTPIYVKQEKWDKIKNELKSFDETKIIFETK